MWRILSDFASALAGLTANRLVRTNASKQLESNAALTADRVLTADANGWPETDATISTAQTWTFTGAANLYSSGFKVVYDVDPTKTFAINVGAQSTGADFQFNVGAQTVDRTLSVPVLTGDRTLAVIDQAQTFSPVQTFTLAPVLSALTASRLVRTDGSKALESNAALTSTRVLYADGSGWPTDSANLTFSGTLLTLGTGATGGLTIAATTGTTLTVSSTTDSTSKDTGSIVTEGGLGVEKAIYAGGNVVVGAGSGQKVLFVNGGNSGSNGGSGIIIENNGTDVLLLGNRSALLGGAFDATPIMYIGPSGASTLQASGSAVFSGTLSCNPTISVGDGSTTATVAVNGAAGTSRQVVFYTNASARWFFNANTAAESGSNAGSDFTISAYGDGGAFIDEPFKIFRASGGAIALARPLTNTSSILSSNATLGIGYATGAGGSVTQITSRTTGVTLNKVCGAITLVSAAGSATWQTFTVTNSAVAATDTITVNQKSGTDLYMIHVTNVAAGSFKISFATTGGTTSEQPVFNFSIHKAVTA